MIVFLTYPTHYFTKPYIYIKRSRVVGDRYYVWRRANDLELPVALCVYTRTIYAKNAKWTLADGTQRRPLFLDTRMVKGTRVLPTFRQGLGYVTEELKKIVGRRQPSLFLSNEYGFCSRMRTVSNFSRKYLFFSRYRFIHLPIFRYMYIISVLFYFVVTNLIVISFFSFYNLSIWFILDI